MHDRMPSTGTDMPVGGATAAVDIYNPRSRPGSAISSASSLADSLGPGTPQAPNSTEEVLSQLSKRHSGTLSGSMGSPLPSVAELRSAEGLPEQHSAERWQQAPSPPPPQQQQPAHQQAAHAWQSLQTAPPQLSPQHQQEQQRRSHHQQQQPQQKLQQQSQQQSMRGQQQASGPDPRRKSAEESAAEAFAALIGPDAGSRKRQTSDEHRRGDVAQLSSYGWLSTGGDNVDSTASEAAKADAAGRAEFQYQVHHGSGPALSGSGSGGLQTYSSGGSVGGGGGGNNKRISRDSDRGEDEVPAPPRTARDSDTAAWVASGLEERQSEEQAADRTSAEMAAAAGEAAAALPWAAERRRSRSDAYSRGPRASADGNGNTSRQSRRPATPGPATLYDIDERDYVVHELLLQSKDPIRAADLREDGTENADAAAARHAGENDEDGRGDTNNGDKHPIAELRAVAERAFWDVLSEGLSDSPPTWRRLAALVTDAREQLAELVPPNGTEAAQQLRTQLHDKLETSYVAQRLEAGYDPAYLRQLFDFLTHVVASLEAPARSEATRQGYAAIKERFSAAVAAQNAALLRAKADAAHPATGDANQRTPSRSSTPPLPRRRSSDPSGAIGAAASGAQPASAAGDAESSGSGPVRLHLRPQEAWVPVEKRVDSQGGGEESFVSTGAPLEEGVDVRLDVAGAASAIAPAAAAESALLTPQRPGRTSATGGLQADDAADSRSITSSAAASAVAHAASGMSSFAMAPPCLDSANLMSAAAVAAAASPQGGSPARPRSPPPRLGSPGLVQGGRGPRRSSSNLGGSAAAAAGAAEQCLAPELVTAVVGAARFVFDRIGRLKQDMAAARLEMLRSLLQGSSSGVEYERRRYQRAIPAGADAAAALPKTAAWIRNIFQTEDVLLQHVSGEQLVFDAVVEGVLQLLQLPVAVGEAECPETLLLDRGRLVAAQNELQRLSLTAAALLIAAQLLAMKRLPPGTSSPENRRFYGAVRDRFSALLAQADVSMPALVAELDALLQARCAATTALPGAGAGGGSGDRELVGRLLARIFSTEDPVYQKVQRGVVAALRLLLLEKSPAEATAVLRSIGAELVADDTGELAAGLERMASLNCQVCRPYYATIVAAAAAEARRRAGPRKSIDLARRAVADARRRAEQGSPGPGGSNGSRSGSGERPRRHSYDDGARRN